MFDESDEKIVGYDIHACLWLYICLLGKTYTCLIFSFEDGIVSFLSVASLLHVFKLHAYYLTELG